METAVSPETLVTTYDTADFHNTVEQNPTPILYKALTQAASDDGNKYQKSKHIADPDVKGTLSCSVSWQSIYIDCDMHCVFVVVLSSARLDNIDLSTCLRFDGKVPFLNKNAWEFLIIMKSY
jgi:hypothetical protein